MDERQQKGQQKEEGWKNPWRKSRYYSVIHKLEREGKIDEFFELTLNRLTLEEIIAVKLELSSKLSGGHLHGINVWYALEDIVKFAALVFAKGATRSLKECGSFLGIHPNEVEMLLVHYGISEYFTDDREEKKRIAEIKQYDD